MRSKLTGYDVGALLYCPANAHGSIVGAIVEQRFPTPYSLAFCLEDTVREDAVADAERMLRGTLSRIASAAEGGSFFLPPIFVRVRSPEQLLRLAEDELPEGARVRFWDVPGTSWAYAAVTRLAGLGLLPFGSDGWFRPDAGLTWRDFSGVLDKLAQAEAGRTAFPVLAAAWSEKTLAAAEADETAAEAVLTRAELARALNSLLGRCPDGQDAQLQAAAWYRDNQDQTAWYYADLIEASADHTCRLLPQGEQWTAIG